MTDTIVNNCEPTTSMKDAKTPFISPLIPIKGLRHDENGELTKDAIQTIFDGMKSLGIDPTKDDTKTAIIKEAKNALCKINSQYEFLVKSSIADEDISTKDLLALLSEKNQTMKDIISVSRRVIDMKPKDDSMIEGFLNINTNSIKSLRESFDKVAKMVEGRSENFQDLSGNEFRRETLEVSEQKNRSVDTYLSLYGFMNIVAVGLLFYIISVK